MHSETFDEMTTLSIYSPTGDKLHTLSVNKDAKVFRQLGGDYYIELSFRSAKYLSFPLGSYIDATGLSNIRFALKADATPEPITGVNGYKYALKFYAPQHQLERCQIKWLTYDDKGSVSQRELTFSLTTSLHEYAKLIAKNMNDYLEVNTWEVAEYLSEDKYTKDMQEQSFDGVSCWDAMDNIAKAFGVEWWIEHSADKQIIHFGKCEVDGKPIDIREGEIVNRYPAAKRGDDSNYGTRFYIYGGTQNIPANYEGSSAGTDVNHVSEKRLRPRATTQSDYMNHYDAVKGLTASQIVERTIILNDIFPKADKDVSNVITEARTINGEENVLIYLIEVDAKPELIGQLGITFTSGALMGRSFGGKYHEYNDDPGDGNIITTQWIEVIYEIEGVNGSAQVVVPNANLCPKAGDKYILTGVKLDNESIKLAETKLYAKGTELANQYAVDTNVYDCPVNPVYCQPNKVNLEIGAKVNLVGAQFGAGRKSRIQGYEKKLYNHYIATYNIGDNRTYSRWTAIETDFVVAQAKAEKKQEQKEQTLKIQALSNSSEAQVKSLQIEVNKLKGSDDDTAESVSITGAKLYAENVRTVGYTLNTNGEKVYKDTSHSLTVVGARKYTEEKVKTLQDNVQSGAISPTRLLIGGTQDTNEANLGFHIYPSADYKAKYKIDANKLVVLTADNASQNMGVCVFVDKEYNDVSIEGKPSLGLSLGKNDLLVSDGTQWRKLSSTSIEGRTGEISKGVLVQLLTTGEADNNGFTPLAKQEQVTDHEERISKVERRVRVAVVTPSNN